MIVYMVTVIAAVLFSGAIGLLWCIFVGKTEEKEEEVLGL